MHPDSDAIEQKVRDIVAGLRELFRQDALEVLKEAMASRPKSAAAADCPDGTGPDRINKREAAGIARRSERWIDLRAAEGAFEKFGGPHEHPWFSRRQVEAHCEKTKQGPGKANKRKRDEQEDRVAAALRKAEH